MFLEYLQAKIHMAVVTEANPDYHGSITLDQDLLDATGIAEYQKILVANVANGARFETYVIAGKPGSGTVGLNGAAALLGTPGDKVIAMTFCVLSAEEVHTHRPRVITVSGHNRPSVLVPA
jgi:aspartate 1-decarboxylase